VLRRLAVTPKLKLSFHLDIDRSVLDDPKKLRFKLIGSAKVIREKAKVSGKHGSKQSSSPKLEVSVSLAEEDADGDDMDTSLPLASFQDTLADKASRVSRLCL
jgi:hypothetical protein